MTNERHAIRITPPCDDKYDALSYCNTVTENLSIYFKDEPFVSGIENHRVQQNGTSSDGKKRIHVHYYVEMSKRRETVRTYLKRTFPDLVGNKCLSIKAVGEDDEDELKYIAYVLKEGMYTQQNLSEELFQKALAHDLEVKTEIKELKEQRKSLHQKVEENCLNQYIKPLQEKYLNTGRILTVKECPNAAQVLSNIIVETYVAANAPISISQCRSRLLLILCKYFHYTSSVAEEIRKDIT